MEKLNVLVSHLGAGQEANAKLTAAAEEEEVKAIDKLKLIAAQYKLDIAGGSIRRTSSRFCLGVEHGDYNGTELFGVGTDRFIWLAFKPRTDNVCRLVSANFEKEGIVQWTLGKTPPPNTPELSHSWARFPYGADYVLTKAGYNLTHGFDGVIFGNIPGGGMSRSASISINLILTLMDASNLKPTNPPPDANGKSFEIVSLAQKLENEYMACPSGYLDQIMIYYAREGLGTHFIPATKSIKYVPLGCDAQSFSFGALDTGTDRPGLEKSTYAIRSRECKQMSQLLSQRFEGVKTIGDLDDAKYATAMREFSGKYPGPCERMQYIYEAKTRFNEMLNAWRSGDMVTVGKVFRVDGHGLRDKYRISGPELQTMVDIVASVPGCLGERMLGGGDKGASGCIVAAGSEAHVLAAVSTGYPRARPDLKDKWAVHFVKVCNGVTLLEGRL
ncbi:Galactokinase [Diplonema papillatum]|nr:Galactokinase [Diplonema papillatum]